jgi:hypothetical protein
MHALPHREPQEDGPMIISLAYFPHDPAAIFALAITGGIAALLFFAGRRSKKKDPKDES